MTYPFIPDRSGNLLDASVHGGLHAQSVRRQLYSLLALLSLENVGDPERVEAGCFAEIDPWDPRIDEI